MIIDPAIEIIIPPTEELLPGPAIDVNEPIKPSEPIEGDEEAIIFDPIKAASALADSATTIADLLSTGEPLTSQQLVILWANAKHLELNKNKEYFSQETKDNANKAMERTLKFINLDGKPPRYRPTDDIKIKRKE